MDAKRYVDILTCIYLTIVELEHPFPLCIAFVYIICELPVQALSHVFYCSVHLKMHLYDLFID